MKSIKKKKKFLIFGSSGLLGFSLSLYLSNQSSVDLFGTFRKKKPPLKKIKYVKVTDLTKKENLEKIIKKINPDILINCLSVKNYLDSSMLQLVCMYSLIPKILNDLSYEYNFKIINISSDIVYGSKLNFLFHEKSPLDLNNNYALSKYLGEILSKNVLNIRTSIFGHSLYFKKGILDWFLSQKECNLYENYFFSGISAYELSKIIYKISSKGFIPGVYNIGSKKISKYHLLKKVMKIYNHKPKIFMKKLPKVDFSFSSNKFINDFNIKIESIDKQISDMLNLKNEFK